MTYIFVLVVMFAIFYHDIIILPGYILIKNWTSIVCLPWMDRPFFSSSAGHVCDCYFKQLGNIFIVVFHLFYCFDRCVEFLGGPASGKGT